MGNLGAAELLLIIAALFAFPAFTYWLGRRSGYKAGQLEVYKKIDRERQNERK